MADEAAVREQAEVVRRLKQDKAEPDEVRLRSEGRGPVRAGLAGLTEPFFPSQIAKEVAKLLEMKARLGGEEGKHKFVLKTPKVSSAGRRAAPPRCPEWRCGERPFCPAQLCPAVLPSAALSGRGRCFVLFRQPSLRGWECDLC